MEPVREEFRWYCDRMLRHLGSRADALDISTVRGRMLRQPGFHVDLSSQLWWPASGKRGLGPGVLAHMVRLRPKDRKPEPLSLLSPRGVMRAAMQMAIEGKTAEERARMHRALRALVTWVEMHESENVREAAVLDEGRARCYPQLRPMLKKAENEPLWKPDPDAEWRSEWALLALAGNG